MQYITFHLWRSYKISLSATNISFSCIILDLKHIAYSFRKENYKGDSEENEHDDKYDDEHDESPKVPLPKSQY